MELTISDVDYAPEDLYEQTPLIVDLVREFPGDDRPDYWLGKLQTPVRWLHENDERRINYVVLAARWEGTRIEPRVESLPVGIAFVTDESLLNDSRLDFSKCSYVAIGISHDTSAGERAERPQGVLVGTIGRFFGTGNQ
jgi:hypothetical protein